MPDRANKGPIANFSGTDNREEEMDLIMERIRRGEKLQHFETERRRKDGEIIDVSVTISPIVGPKGVVSGASMAVTTTISCT